MLKIEANMLRAGLVLALTLLLSGCASAQYLANDTVHTFTFNNTEYFAGPGGWQEVLYEDATSAGPDTSMADTGMVWTRIYLAPCGLQLPQIHNGFTELSYIVQGTVLGGLANPQTNSAGARTFTAPAVVPVDRSAMHSAENPSCTEPVVLYQALSGGDHFLQQDILTAVTGMSPSSVQYGMGLPNGQVQASAGTMRPIFALNTYCLARCGLTAPSPGAAGPTPSLAG